MATLIRTALAFALGALVAGFVQAATSAFILGDVDPDFTHQPLAAFANLVFRHLFAGLVQAGIFGMGLLAARLLFAQKVAEWVELAAVLGFGLVVVNYVLSLIVRKAIGGAYDVAGLVFGLTVPLILAFVYPALTRRRRVEAAGPGA